MKVTLNHLGCVSMGKFYAVRIGRETGVFKKIILVSDEEKIFYVDSVFAHSIQLWYQTLGQLMDKDILITDNAKDAYAYILNKDIGVYK